MSIDIIKIEHFKRISRSDKVTVSVNGLTGKRKFEDVPKGEYILVKIETLNDRTKVEGFIKELRL
jgi:hypothetical protein